MNLLDCKDAFCLVNEGANIFFILSFFTLVVIIIFFLIYIVKEQINRDKQLNKLIKETKKNEND